MHTRVLGIPLASMILLGCPADRGQGAQTSASSVTATPTPASGPLANLESVPFLNEVWIANEGGEKWPFLNWPAQNVRLSSQCRQASGELACDAIRALRGAPVEIPRSALTGNISAGTRVCAKLGQKVVTGHTADGGEDGFCLFGDGSMVSTGALEQYAMRVVD